MGTALLVLELTGGEQAMDLVLLADDKGKSTTTGMGGVQAVLATKAGGALLEKVARSMSFEAASFASHQTDPRAGSRPRHRRPPATPPPARRRPPRRSHPIPTAQPSTSLVITTLNSLNSGRACCRVCTD